VARPGAGECSRFVRASATASAMASPRSTGWKSSLPFSREVAHPGDPHRGVVDDTGESVEIRAAGVSLGLSHQLEPKAHHVQRVVEIVRYPRGDFPDRLQAVAVEQHVLRPPQLGFGVGLLRDVVHEQGHEPLVHVDHLGPDLEDPIVPAAAIPAQARGLGVQKRLGRFVQRQIVQRGVDPGARFVDAERLPRPRPVAAGEVVPAVVVQLDPAVAHEREGAVGSPQRPPPELEDGDPVPLEILELLHQRVVLVAKAVVLLDQHGVMLDDRFTSLPLGSLPAGLALLAHLASGISAPQACTRRLSFWYRAGRMPTGFQRLKPILSFVDAAGVAGAAAAAACRRSSSIQVWGNPRS